MIIFAWVESRTIVQDYADFWCIKLCGIIAGLVLIPVLYYTINGALGVMPDWVNITIFVIAAAVIFYIETKLFLANRSVCRSFLPARAILLLLAATFVVLTFVSPQLPIFKDPQSGTYGYFETT